MSRTTEFVLGLALALRVAIAPAGEAVDVEWADVIRDLEQVQQVEVDHHGHQFFLRSQLSGTAGRVFQAAGVAAPPTVQQVN